MPKYIFLIAGLGLAEICRLNTPVRAADEPYPPTKDTGPHNPLEPKPTPDNGSTIGLVIISGLALLGAQRWRSNELRFRCRDGSTNDNRFI